MTTGSDASFARAVVLAKDKGIAQLGVDGANRGQDTAQVRQRQGGYVVGFEVGKLRGVLGVDGEGRQHAELGGRRDEGGFGGRAGVGDALAEDGAEEVEGRGV